MTSRSLLLHLLREAGDRGLTTAEILQGGVGSRYGARLLELRARGYMIEATRLRPGSWRYVLTDEPPDPDLVPADDDRDGDGRLNPATQSAGTETLFHAPAHQPSFDELCPPSPRSAVNGWDD